VKIFELFFINGNLIEKYENMLRDKIVLTIQIIVGLNFNDVWFQQDGSTGSLSFMSTTKFRRVFPQQIGRRNSIE